MLNKSMLLALMASLLIAAAQWGCSTQNFTSQGAESSGGAPMSLQQACIKEAARIISISSDKIYAIGSTDLGNGAYDVNLMMGARQGICSVDAEGKILSLRGEGGTLY